MIGTVLAFIWGAFYFFIFVMTSMWSPHPTALGPCLWGAILILGCLAGFAVTILIAWRPGIGAPVVLASFLLWLVVEKYRPDTWYMVPALLLPGLLAFGTVVPFAARRPRWTAPDVAEDIVRVGMSEDFILIERRPLPLEDADEPDSSNHIWDVLVLSTGQEYCDLPHDEFVALRDKLGIPQDLEMRDPREDRVFI